MAISTMSVASASAAMTLSGAGITARGSTLLEQARDALVSNPSNYSMIEKLHIYWDLGDAWQDRGWFTDAEKKESQKIIEASIAAGPDGFIHQLGKFEKERLADVTRLGLDADSRKAYAFFKTYEEPWKQEYLKGQMTNLEISYGVAATLKSRDGQNGFNFMRDTRDGISLSVADIKDPTARKALELLRDYRVSQNFGSWRDRQSAADSILAELRKLASAPSDIVELSPKAQSYLRALNILGESEQRGGSAEWRLQILAPKKSAAADKDTRGASTDVSA
jgi:hypothetical protein